MPDSWHDASRKVTEGTPPQLVLSIYFITAMLLTKFTIFHFRRWQIELWHFASWHSVRDCPSNVLSRMRHFSKSIARNWIKQALSPCNKIAKTSCTFWVHKWTLTLTLILKGKHVQISSQYWQLHSKFSSKEFTASYTIHINKIAKQGGEPFIILSFIFVRGSLQS